MNYGYPMGLCRRQFQFSTEPLMTTSSVNLQNDQARLAFAVGSDVIPLCFSVTFLVLRCRQ